MADSWTLVLFFPIFVVAIVWLKGFGFFNVRFLTRLLMWGALGMLLYFLLPLMAGGGASGFWQAFKYTLADQKQHLWGLWSHYRLFLMLLSLTSLVPLFLISIRWASYFGDTSPLGTTLTTFIFHVVHFVLLLACIWVMFDPAFSPREVAIKHHIPVNLLMFYYLSALVVGYLAGYFLRIFGRYKGGTRQRNPGQQTREKIAVVVLGVLLVFTPVGLVYKNLGRITQANGPALRQYANLLNHNLPDLANVLSDDAMRMLLAETAMAATGRSSHYQFLESAWLTSPDYHKFLKKKYPATWDGPIITTNIAQFDGRQLAAMMARFSEKIPIYYLHPSFGYYFERFYPEPHGLVNELKLYPTNVLYAPTMSPALIAENEAFWKETDSRELKAVVTAITPPADTSDSAIQSDLMRGLRVVFEPDSTATLLGRFYSHALTQWGVEVQKAGQFDLAGKHFTRATELNPDNPVAAKNLKFNQDWRAGKRPSVEVLQAVEDQFGRYTGWDSVLEANGFFDEPSLCFAEGRTFSRWRRPPIRPAISPHGAARATKPPCSHLAATRCHRQPSARRGIEGTSRSRRPPVGFSGWHRQCVPDSARRSHRVVRQVRTRQSRRGSRPGSPGESHQHHGARQCRPALDRVRLYGPPHGEK